MKPVLALILILAAFVSLKLKMEAACDRIVPGALSIDLREQIGQSAFIAVLGGFRSVMADLLFIDAYSAWERTDWTYLLLRLRQATELQPRAILFWEMAIISSWARIFSFVGLPTIRRNRNSTKRWHGCIATSFTITSGQRRISKKRRVFRTMPLTTSVFPPTSFLTPKAANARLTIDCAPSTSAGKNSASRVCLINCGSWKSA